MARKKKTKKKKNDYFAGIKAMFTGTRFLLMRKFLFIFLPSVFVLTGIAVGLGYLEGYVKNVAAERSISIELEFVGEKPTWAPLELISDINLSSGINSDDFLLDDDLVNKAYKSISVNPWVESVNSVRKCYSGIIQFDYSLRCPVAKMIKGDQIYYIDSEGIVIPYAPIDRHLVCIKGSRQALPKPGMQVKQSDILAALDILKKIQFVDNNLTNNSDAIWTELAVIDVSNFEGRNDPSISHINLYTHKDTQIRWGAAVGREKAYWEADFTTKLTRLYRDFRDYGTLDINTSGIELRNHQ